MTTHLWLRRTITLACAAALSLGSVLPAAAAGLPLRQASNPPPLEQAGEDYVRISDASGVLSVEVPQSWTDVEETEWSLDDEAVGTKLTAAPDLNEFYDSWGVPGLVLSYSESLPQEMTAEELLDIIDYSEVCKAGDVDEITDGPLVGVFRIWEECNGTTTAAIAALGPADADDYFVLMEIYVVDESDLEALNHIIETLQVGGATGDDATGGDEPTVTTTSDSPLLEAVDTSDYTYSYVELRAPAIVALVPEEYGELEAAVWETSDGEPLGFTITAAPSIQDFNDTWTAPGMIIKSAMGLTELLDPDEMLADDSLTESCTYDDRYTDERTTDDGVTYTIDYDWYNNCGESESSYVAGLAKSDPADEAIFFDFLIADAADEEALDAFLQSFSLDRDLVDEATSAAATESGSTTTTEGAAEGAQGEDSPALAFIDVADDSGTISLRVPETWTDTASGDWDLGDGPIGTAFTVAPSVQDFEKYWDVPGIFIGVSEEEAVLTPAEKLDEVDFSEGCTYGDRYDYESANLAGVYDVWENCGDVEGATYIVLAATPVGEESPLVLLNIALPTEEDAAAFGELVDSLAIAGAVTSVEETQQEELLTAPLAIVEVDSLNIRSGPGTNYNRVGVASQGDALVVDGQVDNCDWLKITTADGIEGWASGKDQYVTLDTRCTDIPEAQRPAPPAESAAPQDGGARSGQGDQGSTQSGSAAGSSDQGCYLFQNQLGSELTITFTRTETGRGTTFQVGGNGETEKCFDPGRYTYTIDAPPPWNSINGELTVQAGDAFLFPISAE